MVHFCYFDKATTHGEFFCCNSMKNCKVKMQPVEVWEKIESTPFEWEIQWV